MAKKEKQFKKYNSKKKQKEKLKIKKTVQQTIPYLHVYEEDGIIETREGIFTKSYLLQDINYQIAKYEDQEDIFSKYNDALNSFDPNLDVQFIINNRSINQEDFEKNTFLKYQGDRYDVFREEYNKMLLDKIREGKNNIAREKYLVIALEADEYSIARSKFARLDTEISTNFKKIGQSNAIPLTTMERLEILHDIYNLGKEGTFGVKVLVGGNEATNFTFSHMKKQGLTTKDMIGPMSMEFNRDHIVIDDKLARVMYLDRLPTFLRDTIIDDLVSISANMITSLQIKPVSQDEARKTVERQITNLDANIAGVKYVNHKLKFSREEAEELMEDLTSRNQKMFLLTLTVVVFADTMEELDKLTDILDSTARKHVCTMRKLFFQQEAGFTTTLPLAYNRLDVKRTLTTESTAVFIPFSSQELMQPKGMYYGLNAVSRNLILYDRFTGDNYNGFILGTSGSGKSFAAKREMVNVLLNTNDDVIVIDPEREYVEMAKMLGGKDIRLAPGSGIHINPLDMDAEYADDDNPINLKYSFLISLLETVIGGQYGLSPSQRSIVDRTVRMLYEKYMVDFNPANLPTLLDFQALLESQSERDAKELALALEIYTKGSLNIFAKETNVDINSRFLVYDIKDIGSNMKTMAMLVVLDNIWNRIIENRRKGKRTWFYIDEIYLLFNNEVSAQFLQEIYKRARKWDGVPTGITQNIEDILKSETARTMLSNSSFIMMLNQAPLDKAHLAHLLNISETQLGYISNSNKGEGLIYTGRSIVPFIDKFPTGTKLYKSMTTKSGE